MNQRRPSAWIQASIEHAKIHATMRLDRILRRRYPSYTTSIKKTEYLYAQYTQVGYRFTITIHRGRGYRTVEETYTLMPDGQVAKYSPYEFIQGRGFDSTQEALEWLRYTLVVQGQLSEEEADTLKIDAQSTYADHHGWEVSSTQNPALKFFLFQESMRLYTRISS